MNLKEPTQQITLNYSTRSRRSPFTSFTRSLQAWIFDIDEPVDRESLPDSRIPFRPCPMMLLIYDVYAHFILNNRRFRKGIHDVSSLFLKKITQYPSSSKIQCKRNIKITFAWPPGLVSLNTFSINKIMDAYIIAVNLRNHRHWIFALWQYAFFWLSSFFDTNHKENFYEVR